MPSTAHVDRELPAHIPRGSPPVSWNPLFHALLSAPTSSYRCALSRPRGAEGGSSLPLPHDSSEITSPSPIQIEEFLATAYEELYSLPDKSASDRRKSARNGMPSSSNSFILEN